MYNNLHYDIIRIMIVYSLLDKINGNTMSVGDLVHLLRMVHRHIVIQDHQEK